MATAKKNPNQEALHKLFLAGLGLAEETNQRLTATFNALVKKGQAKEPEVKRAVEDIRKKIQAKRKELEKKFITLVKENELVKSKEFQALLKKVEELQKKAKEGAKTAAKPSVKPAAAKQAVSKKPAKKKAPAKKPAAAPAAAAPVVPASPAQS
jgi:polyhydroxyalkanoate synthesis regulator phasin